LEKRRDLASAGGPVAVITLFYGVVLVILLATHGWDPRFFATVGPQWARHDPSGTRAADGARFYAIAQDPAMAAPMGAKRASRMLYPLVARAVALGQPALIPWALMLVNWAAIVAGTAIMARILAWGGLTRWYALGYGAWGGLGLALLHGTAEPLAYLLAVVGIAAAQRGHDFWAGSAFLGALLSHESVIVLLAPYALSLGRDRRAVWRWGLPAAVFTLWAIWQGLVGRWVGQVTAPVRFARWTLWMFPLRGYRSIQRLHLPATLVQLILPAAAAVGYAAWRLWREPAEHRLWAVLLTGLFALCLPHGSAALLWHSGRLSTGLVVATLVAWPVVDAPRLWRGLVSMYVSSALWTLAVAVRYALWDVAPW
jgi:hypothetical protein